MYYLFLMFWMALSPVAEQPVQPETPTWSAPSAPAPYSGPVKYHSHKGGPTCPPNC